MKQKLFYVKTGHGCGIRKGTDEDDVYERELRKVGTYAGVDTVREATLADIAWVRAMGGYVPEIADSAK